MTSSLVGSEMCIRDRPTPAALCSERSVPSASKGWPLATAGAASCLPFSCLLYTSDAADDM
eukprot:7642908-Prorocentrum_lima.AAC.1